MSPSLRSAIAVSFDWVTASPDFSIAFASGTSPVAVTVPSGTYRMFLAPLGTDFIRVVEKAINDALVAAGRTEVFTFVMSSTGRVVLTSTGPFTIAPLPIVLRFMGFSVPMVNGTVITAEYQPCCFATFVSRASNGWVPRTMAAGGETLAGMGYGVSTGVSYEEDDVMFDFVPPDPSTRTSLGIDQTPWQPEYGVDLGAHTGQWSVRDILASAQGKTCAAALGCFQAVRASTSERYDLVTIPTSEITSPRKERLRDGWDAYFRWKVRLLRQSEQTGTRS